MRNWFGVRSTSFRGGLLVLVLLTGALVVAGAPLVFAQDDADDAGDDAQLRIVHVSPDAGPIDVYADGSLFLDGLAFGTASALTSLPAGQVQIQVTESGGDAPIIEGTVELLAGEAYQLVAVGEVQGGTLAAALDTVNLGDLADGQARLRVHHAVPDAGPIEFVGADGEPVFESLEFIGASPYGDFPAGSINLQVVNAGTDEVLIDAIDVELESGTVYDVFAIGLAADGSLELLVVSAVPGAVATPEAEVAELDEEVDALPAELRTGTCDGLGAVAFELNDLVEGGTPAVGALEANEVLTSITTIEAPFDDIVATDHAVTVLASDDPDLAEVIVACGSLGGGTLENGGLPIGLLTPAGDVFVGVAYLLPAEDTTIVHVFLDADLELDVVATPVASPDADLGDLAIPTLSPAPILPPDPTQPVVALPPTNPPAPVPPTAVPPQPPAPTATNPPPPTAVPTDPPAPTAAPTDPPAPTAAPTNPPAPTDPPVATTADTGGNPPAPTTADTGGQPTATTGTL